MPTPAFRANLAGILRKTNDRLVYELAGLAGNPRRSQDGVEWILLKPNLNQSAYGFVE